MTIDPLLHSVIALLLAVMFAVTSFSKLRDIEKFSLNMAAYKIVPSAFLRAASIWIILSEIMACALLLAQFVIADLTIIAAVVTVDLMLTYALVIGINLLRGRTHIDCGCHMGGPAGRISVALVVRNLVLATMGAALILPVNAREWMALDFAGAIFCVIAAIVLLQAADSLRQNSELWGWSKT